MSLTCASKVACDCRTPRWAMKMGARLGNNPRRRHSGCANENVSPEANDGFTVAKLLLVVARVLARLTPRVVPVCSCWEKLKLEVWLSVLNVEAPVRVEALGETERVGAKLYRNSGSKGWWARSTANCERSD